MSAPSGAAASPITFTVAPTRLHRLEQLRQLRAPHPHPRCWRASLTKSATDDCWISRPLPITIRSWAISDISDRRWLLTSTVRPWSA